MPGYGHRPAEWQRNIAKDFDGKMMSQWKYSKSPLVDGEKVICTPGGKQAMMAALDKRSGKTIWTCPMPEIGGKGTDGAAYSSAVAAQIAGVRQYVQLVGRGVIGVEADSGRFLWGYNPVANTVANVTTPIVHGDYVFATSAYNTGAVLLKITRAGERFTAEEIYFIAPGDFQNHHRRRGARRRSPLRRPWHQPRRLACLCRGYGKGILETAVALARVRGRAVCRRQPDLSL